MLAAVLLATQTLGMSVGEGLRVPVSMALAVLPGLSWLGLLYVQERIRGHATEFLPTVVVLGALVASALGVPFLEQVADIGSWLPAGTPTIRFLGNLLLVAPTHMFLIYAVVRYTVLRTSAFEHRVDGILYTVAAAIGYATMLNIQMVISQGGFEPASGIFRVIGDVVGHAGAASVLGFFLGRYRHENMPFWYLPSGLLLAVLIDGTMIYSRVEINRTALSLTRDSYSPWNTLTQARLQQES
jgi:RsiW-degrading membrane proteinase PrsW (M82 family)